MNTILMKAFSSKIKRYVFFFFLIPAFCYGNSSPLYLIKVQIDPVKSYVEGKEIIKFEIPFSTDSIPFIFSHKGNVNGLIRNIKVNHKPANLTSLSQNGVSGFYLTGFDKFIKGEKQEVSFEFKSDSIPYSDGYFAAVQEWMPCMPFIDNEGFHIMQAGLKDFDLTMSFPSSYTAATTGIITSKKQYGKELTLNSSIKQVTYYGICLSDKFKVDEVQADGLKIYSYYFKDDPLWGNKLLGMAKNAVNFYKNHFGFYPADQLSILPGGSHPNGGFPISSNMYVIHRGLDERGKGADNFAQWITAHEIGHFYWGFGNVLFDQSYSIWFQISMGIYADWLFSEYAHLDKSVYDFDKRYMAGVINNFNTTIMQPVNDLAKINFDYNNVIDHGKSFTVLMMLKDVIGTKKFEKVYLSILNNYKGKLISIDEFQTMCEKQSGLNLDWFFKEWYKSNGYIDYNISHVSTKILDSLNTQVVCCIENRGNNYMPLDIQVETQNGQRILKTIDGNFHDSTTININVKGSLQNVQIDPQHKLPMLSRYRLDTTTIYQAVGYALDAKNYPQYFTMLNLLKSIPATHNNYSRFLYGQLLFETGQYNSAIQILSEVADTGSGYNAEKSLLELGNIYDATNDRKKAIVVYKKEIADGKSQYLIKLSKKYLESPYAN